MVCRRQKISSGSAAGSQRESGHYKRRDWFGVPGSLRSAAVDAYRARPQWVYVGVLRALRASVRSASGGRARVRARASRAAKIARARKIIIKIKVTKVFKNKRASSSRAAAPRSRAARPAPAAPRARGTPRTGRGPPRAAAARPRAAAAPRARRRAPARAAPWQKKHKQIKARGSQRATAERQMSTPYRGSLCSCVAVV